jgi:segregation and condensation protein A
MAPDDGLSDLAPQSDGDADVEARLASEALLVDVDGFEGPLDILLILARTQKVDLRKISILELAEQYLRFVEEAKKLRIELAADYLVMAAWLAFLKSRLLLPPDPEEEGPSGEELAAHLAFQLERLEAMRRVAAQLMARDQKGREFFVRGETTDVSLNRKTEWDASLLDLLQAYARVKTKESFSPLTLKREAVLTMEAALESMRSLMGATVDWATLSSFLPEGWQVDPKRRRSAMAASFAASLEMVKSGEIDLKQDGLFAPLLIRKKGEAHVAQS